MPALEVLAVPPEQKRAGSQQFAPTITSVLEAAAGHDGDRVAGMLLLERMILRTVVADHIVSPPSRPFRQQPGSGLARSAVQRAVGHSRLEFSRNIYQEWFPALFL